MPVGLTRGLAWIDQERQAKRVLLLDKSRIPRFYKMTLEERVEAVRSRGIVSDDDYQALSTGDAPWLRP